MKKLLLNARNLISEKKNWTQGEGARNALGVKTFPSSKDAVCWCMLGAIYKFDTECDSALKKIEEYIPNSIVTFNDNSTHKEVLALLDKVIEDL